MENGANILDGAEYEEVDIFLSYNHDDDLDDGRPSRLYDRLIEAGYRVAFDKGLRGGEDFVDWINVNVARAKLVVALWSTRSLAADWCRYEAQCAHAQRKLFPIELERIGDEAVPKFLLAAAATALRVPYDAPNLLEQIAHRVTASRAEAERRRAASARAILASQKAHLPEVLASAQPDLFGRDVEESMLLDSWASCAPGADAAKKTNLVVLYAIGGAGKTALMRRLVDDLAASDFPHAEKVIGWSAYSQGSGDNRNADADGFISAALDMMGYEGEKPGDSVARARLLAGLMQKKRTLLLLDGIEPLQSPAHVNLGRLKDKGLAALLTELARDNPGLVVVTSRQPLPETEKIARVRNHALEELRPQAGAALLKRLGCWGAAKDLEAASREADGHALTLTALGGYIESVESGDIRKRDHFKLGEITFTAEEMAAPDPTVRAAKKAARVMQGYIEAFTALDKSSKGEGIAERVLLNIIGLFDRPADGTAVEALLDGEPIAGLTDTMAAWTPHQKTGRIAAAKKRLRTLKLLNDADPEDQESLDAHPIVRAHFAKAFADATPEAFRAAHERLYRLYAAACVKDLPDTLEEMTPLFHAIGHACAAGLHQEAFDEVYWKRVRRKDASFINKHLGAFGANLGALAHFFNVPWGAVNPNLSRPDQGSALNYAASALRALGRLAEAEEADSAGLVMDVELQSWGNASRSALNVSEVRLALGAIAGAIVAAEQAVEYADRSGEAFVIQTTRTSLADALAQAGQLGEAAARFADAELRQEQAQPELPRLYSVQGCQYCDLLLDFGRAAEVGRRAAYGLAVGTTLLDIALNQLIDGRALALLSAHGRADGTAVRARLDLAVAALRRAGADDDLPRGLFARAQHLRRMNEFAPAAKDLEEAFDIAERGGMKLFLADHALESARLALVQIADVSPEKLVALTETVEVALAPPSSRFSLVDLVFGKKPVRRAPERPQQVVSPTPWRPRREPLTENERRHLADAEAHYAKAFELVQDTGYHRRDAELADLRARLDPLARLA